jgi:anti-sigma-K factor RskA
MNCIRDEKLLELYIDGELDQSDLARVESAVTDCEHCRDYVADAAVVRSALQDSIAEAVNAAPLATLWERIEEQLDAGEQTQPDSAETVSSGWFERFQAWVAPRKLQVAFALCAAIVATVFAFRMILPPSQPGNEQPAIAMSQATVKNTLVVESLDISQGTVVIDADPTGEMPTVVWHFIDEEQEGS